jgi:NAD(P)-dependent dehydrogenase (short-subunit alcohol dehydrogenase family)
VQESTHGFSAEELALAKKVLHAISLRRSLITEGGAEIDELRRLAARIVRQERTEQKRSPKSRRSGRQNDLGLLAKTGMRRLRRARSLNKPVPVLEPAPEAPASLEKARRCYICKQHFRELHFFYDSLCPSCAALNFRKRSFSVDLSQRRAVVTGGRIKIGFQVALKLLRAGAEVLVTTRFPRDAAQRYAAEADFAQFAPRLSIVGLDLRDLRAVERFCQQLPAHWPHLDILINNAAQTVRKPEGFYAHLSAREQSPREALPEPVRALFPAVFLENSSLESARAPLSTREAERRLLQQETKGANPVEVLSAQEARDEEKILSAVRDEHQQPLDLRETNSWRLRLAEVETPELVEVHLINAFAPFLLNRGIKPLLLRSPFRDRYIVNVSAMEGQFYKLYKGPNHPHTNMAKAALNMMTLTSASDYAESGIYMTAVDTGWITDENPFVISTMMAANGFEPPLDEVDAAARIVDPVFVGASGGPRSVGEFLKDYAPTPW